MAVLSGEATAEIDAPIERVWSIVEDVATAPEWQRSLHEIEPIERDEHGRVIIGYATTARARSGCGCRARGDRGRSSVELAERVAAAG